MWERSHNGGRIAPLNCNVQPLPQKRPSSDVSSQTGDSPTHLGAD